MGMIFKDLCDLARPKAPIGASCLRQPTERGMCSVQGISGNGMDKATKQYRQYIFKLNHKLAKKTAKQGHMDPESGLVKFKGMLRAASKVRQDALPLSGF